MIKNGTNGADGSYQFINSTDLLIEDNVTIEISAQQATTLQTIEVGEVVEH